MSITRIAFLLSAIAAAWAASVATGPSPATAQLSGVRPAPAPASRPDWFATAEGWQVGSWGAPGDYRWEIDAAGRGTLSILGRPRTGGARPIQRPFALTVPEHVRFASLIARFTEGRQDAALCMTDQAQDIVQWRGGTRGDGLFNFDRGCQDGASMARIALLDQALAILRAAAERQAAS